MVNFKEIYHFSRFQRGSNIFQGGGGVQLFPWGGGSNCLFPIETHILVIFKGGPDPLSPPSGSALAQSAWVLVSVDCFSFVYWYDGCQVGSTCPTYPFGA